MTKEEFVNKYGEPFFKTTKLVSFYNDVEKLILYQVEKVKSLEAENKKLKQTSSILNSLSEEKTCQFCNNKMDYKPRIYHCNHCGSDFN